MVMILWPLKPAPESYYDWSKFMHMNNDKYPTVLEES